MYHYIIRLRLTDLTIIRYLGVSGMNQRKMKNRIWGTMEKPISKVRE